MANYRISELDFDQIKVNLKQFLTNYRDKDNNLVFKDYDFEASSLSILIDLLSYNTHYNAYLANMVANEMFLDSAVKRESAVSIAKHLGYSPLSYRSARAKVSFIVSDPVNTPSSLTLPRYSAFTSTIDGVLYTFSNLDSVTILPVNGIYAFTDVTIVEGQPLTYTYRVDLGGPSEKYSIPNRNVDTTSIRVIVQNSYSDVGQTTFTLAGNLDAITGESNVYFLEENTKGSWDLYFGDGILGKKLTSGNLVKVEYLVSNGSLCNVSETSQQEFTLEVPIGGVTLPSTIIATQNSTGGDEPDTIEEIKFKAPRFLSSFNRAVTANDYKSIIEANYPLVESVSVWGGEDNDPPIYGKVLISLKPYLGFTINTELKTRILQEILADKKMMTIIPEFVDPNYLYISLDNRIKFDSKNSRYTAAQIEVLVKAAVQDYFTSDLQKFDKSFIYSKLSKNIDSIDSSIIGNVTSFRIHKRIAPGANTARDYTGASLIKYANKLNSGTIQSTGFYYTTTDNKVVAVYMKDVLTTTSSGVINLYNLYTDALVASNVATVDYTNGTISIPAFIIAGYFDNSTDIKIYAKIDELDIQTTRGLILVTDDSNLNTEIKQFAGLSVNVTLI
jgi:hypothetical protein